MGICSRTAGLSSRESPHRIWSLRQTSSSGTDARCPGQVWHNALRSLSVHLARMPWTAQSQQKLYSCKQGLQNINKHTNTWESYLAEIPQAEQPNGHDQIFHYNEGLTENLKNLTSVDFSTSKPFTSVKALTTAPCPHGMTSSEKLLCLTWMLFCSLISGSP